MDTACSSSLVAVHVGRSHILSGEVVGALASGVHLLFNPVSVRSLCSAGMLSSCGRCQPLSDTADGYVRGEAAVAMILERDGTCEGNNSRTVLGILRGSAVNQDGRSSSLTAPNGQSQQVVISDAWASAGLAEGPAAITDLGLHGTGTALGDPIEVGAAVASIGSRLPPPGGAPPATVLLQANKASVGHGEAVAGISALLHAVATTGRFAAKPVLHLQGVNRHVESVIPQPDGSAQLQLLLPRAAAPTPLSAEQYSGVSSFAYQVSERPRIQGASRRASPASSLS